MRKRPVFKSIKTLRGLGELHFPDPRGSVNVGSRKHRKEILRIYGGYDCETTTLRTPQGWRSCVYIHQLSIANNEECYVYLLRTWEEYLRLLELIREHYQLGEEKRIILWDANLSFEFSFLQHRLEWGDFFAKEERAPLLVESGGIEYRECLTISGGNLAHLAKTFCYTQKLVGDLDYSKLRNSDTPLTPEEEAYCVNDVVILAEFSRWIFDSHIRKERKVPMTKTGLLSGKLKHRFQNMSKELDKYGAHKQAYLHHIQECYPCHDDYFFYFRWLFRGGYVHANAIYAGVDVYADMWDIKSSYPSVMLTDYVPVSPFEEVAFKPEYLHTKCCILFCTFYGIHITTSHTIESSSKIICEENAVYDNGRLVSADKIQVCITEIDFAIYKKFYAWDERSGVNKCLVAKRGKLPRFLRDELISAYVEKEELSAQGLKDSLVYALKKSDVNTFYGLTVKRIRLDKIVYKDGEWTTEKNTRDYEEEIAGALLSPFFGIWITAHARYNLLSVVYKLDKIGVQVVYCDTDSIKYISSPKAKKIIHAYNRKRQVHLFRRGYRQKHLALLGQYTPEGEHVHLKTLGAKRYLYTDGDKVKATIAGLPKQAIKALGTSEDVIFSSFTDFGFYLAPEESMKKTTEYTDTAYDLYINGKWMHEESGVALYDIPFSLTLKESYAAYITLMQSAERIGYAL